MLIHFEGNKQDFTCSRDSVATFSLHAFTSLKKEVNSEQPCNLAVMNDLKMLDMFTSKYLHAPLSR